MHPIRYAAALLFTILLAATASAAPTNIILFPDGAEVTEDFTVAPIMNADGPVLELRLPSAAQPGGLRVLRGEPAVDVQAVDWRRAEAATPDAARELEQRLDKAVADKDAVDARRQAQTAAVAFWSERAGSGQNDVRQLASVGERISGEVEKLSLASIRDGRRSEELAEQIKELRDKIQAITGPDSRPWIASLRLTAAPAGPVRLHIAYALSGSGWTPLYVANAEPENSRIMLTFKASIHQGYGEDLANAEVSVATMRRDRGTDIPPLPQWIIEPRRERPVPLPLFKTMAAESRAVDAAPAAAPVRVERATYGEWKLGRKTLPSGQERTFTLTTETVPADFADLARPLVAPDAYLLGRGTAKNPLDLPPGRVTLLIDGVMVGESRLELTGRDMELTFGVDPQVDVSRRLVNTLSGEHGIFSSSQSRTWAFETSIRNDKAVPVRIRLEEPAAQPRDERIKVETKHDPQPVREENTWVWDMEVGPGQTRVVHSEIGVKAPDDLPLDFGIMR